MGDLESEVASLSSAEAKVETGQMKPEEHAKLVESAVQKTVDAVQTFPESPAVHVSAARVMIQAGKLDEARQYANRAAEMAPDDPWPVVNRGIAEFESCDFPAASRSALEALRRDSRNQNARAMWSLSQRPAGCNNLIDRLKSRYLGAKMLELAAPGRTPILDILGNGGPAFDAGGAIGQAEAAPIAPAGAPGDRYTREGFQRFQSLMNGAGNALKGGNNERAFDLATAAILAYPENPNALFIRGIAATNLNRHDTVITDATWGIRLDPANKAKWLGMRSNVEAASGRYDAALADALAAVRLDPTPPVQTGRRRLRRPNLSAVPASVSSLPAPPSPQASRPRGDHGWRSSRRVRHFIEYGPQGGPHARPRRRPQERNRSPRPPLAEPDLSPAQARCRRPEARFGRAEAPVEICTIRAARCSTSLRRSTL